MKENICCFGYFCVFYLAELQSLYGALKEFRFVVILVQNLYHDPVFSLITTFDFYLTCKLYSYIHFSKRMLLYVTYN